jgi:hypothetical protein
LVAVFPKCFSHISKRPSTKVMSAISTISYLAVPSCVKFIIPESTMESRKMERAEGLSSFCAIHHCARRRIPLLLAVAGKYACSLSHIVAGLYSLS